MIPATHVGERLAWVRSRVELVFRILVEPSLEALEQCETLLGAAIEEFETSRPSWGQARGDQQALAEARGIRVMASQAGRLLETAAAFHGRWYQLLATRNGGYTSGGAPAQLHGQGRISLQG